MLRSSTGSKNDNQPQVEISESREDGISLFERNCLKVIRNSFKSHQKKILGELHFKRWFKYGGYPFYSELSCRGGMLKNSHRKSGIKSGFKT